MDVVLATANQDKRQELVSLLSSLGVRIRDLNEFHDIPPIIEDGKTCEENAIKKAITIAKHTGMVALADDTVLEVHALNGRPGVYAARYAGEHATYEDNWRKLLKELDGVPAQQRTARFLTTVAIADPCLEVEVVEGILEGRIAEDPSGEGGFGYDPVFEVPELRKTLAELTLDEKNQISHRSQALAKAKEVLERKYILQENVGA